MPANALPEPWPTQIPGLIRHERLYRDVLGRPLRGSAQITGQKRATHGDLVVTPAAVAVRLDDAGRLAVDLPPGTYEIKATLTTADGQRVSETETITLGE